MTTEKNGQKTGTDRPAICDASVQNTEVAPEMIEAGLSVFLGCYPDSGTGDFMDHSMIRRIYLAMVSASLK